MPLWLPNNPVGVCARCNRKMYLTELHPDPNIPGLMVCREDQDLYDPYRLAARVTENIALRTPRPDVPLSPSQPVIATEHAEYTILTEENEQEISVV